MFVVLKLKVFVIYYDERDCIDFSREILDEENLVSGGWCVRVNQLGIFDKGVYL